MAYQPNAFDADNYQPEARRTLAQVAARVTLNPDPDPDPGPGPNLNPNPYPNPTLTVVKLEGKLSHNKDRREEADDRPSTAGMVYARLYGVCARGRFDAYDECFMRVVPLRGYTDRQTDKPHTHAHTSYTPHTCIPPIPHTHAHTSCTPHTCTNMHTHVCF